MNGQDVDDPVIPISVGTGVRHRSHFLILFGNGSYCLAGTCYIANSITDLISPTFARLLSPHLMDPTLIGEGALAVWLLVFGAGKRSRRDR